MRYLFPFGKIATGSKIVIYGAGSVGQQFFLQIAKTQYCEVIHWIDRKFKDSKNSFFGTSTLLSKHDFDVVVIATVDAAYAQEMVQICLNKNIERERIILQSWEVELNIQFPLIPNNLIGNTDIYLDILTMFYSHEQQFGEGKFYQSYESVGLKGQRPTQERFIRYGILNIIRRQDEILDIGCNCGFFDLQLAKYAGHIVGIDTNWTLIEVAKKVQTLVNDTKCTFLNEDFKNVRFEKKFNVIMAYAVIHWIDMDKEDFINKIDKLLIENGHIILESHNVESEDRLRRYREYIDGFTQRQYAIYFSGVIKDDGRIKREFCILKK